MAEPVEAVLPAVLSVQPASQPVQQVGGVGARVGWRGVLGGGVRLLRSSTSMLSPPSSGGGVTTLGSCGGRLIVVFKASQYAGCGGSGCLAATAVSARRQSPPFGLFDRTDFKGSLACAWATGMSGGDGG